MEEVLFYLLEKKEFVNKVREAGKITEETGYETGFVVLRHEDELKYGEVTLGNTNSWPQSSARDSARGITGKREGSLHFHPGKEESDLAPSPEDLRNIAEIKEVKPEDKWMMIGVKGRESIKLLFLYPLHLITFFEINLWQECRGSSGRDLIRSFPALKEADAIFGSNSREDLVGSLEEFSIASIIVEI